MKNKVKEDMNDSKDRIDEVKKEKYSDIIEDIKNKELISSQMLHLDFSSAVF
mgnify:CR=1 FL=1